MAITVGVIGAGHGGAWVKAFNQIDECQVLALAARPNDTRRHDLATKYSIPHVYDSDVDLLAAHAAHPLDICVVATEPRTHRPVTHNCLEAGSNCLVEKPPATDYVDTRAMFYRSMFVSRCLGWAWCFRQVQNLPPPGRSTSSVAVTWHRSVASGAQWAQDHEVSGGGVLIDYVSHGLDLALDRIGYPAVRSVHAEAFDDEGRRTGGRGHGRVEHRIVGALETEGGTTISLDGDWGAKEEKQEICFSGPFGQDKVCVLADDQLYWRTANAFLKLLFESNRARQLQHTGEGVQLMKVIDALYQSATTGRSVAL